MKNVILFALILYFSLFCNAGTGIKNLTIEKGEKVIVFAPHPDDEVLGCGGLIQRVIKNEGKIFVVYLTNGDHNQIPFRVYEKKIIARPIDYIKLGELRRKESTKATGILGLPQENLIFLGYPDFGCLKIWDEFWGENIKPFMSFLTRTRYVPYKENYSYGKPYISESILSDLKKIIQEVKPTKIFITSPFDTNVDHRALYNFIRAAVLEIKDTKPEIFIYIIHFKDYPKKSSEFLVLPDLPSIADIYSVSLDNNEMSKKELALFCFKSQTVFKKGWFFSFVRKNEVFYKETDENINGNRTLAFESEREAEFKDYKNLSIPFYCTLKKEGEFLNVEFIQKEKIDLLTEYIFYFYPFRKDMEFSAMPKITINLKKEEEILSSTNRYQENLKYEKLKNKISFRVKISDLKYPDYLFFSATIKVSSISYDFIPWEVIKIE
ncbi:MAG: PIG-L family deacetylase [bacterium]|nr:PIG-L family deacetylase [bacterium]